MRLSEPRNPDPDTKVFENLDSDPQVDMADSQP